MARAMALRRRSTRTPLVRTEPVSLADALPEALSGAKLIVTLYSQTSE